MTPRYTQALLVAARAHEGQPRKGTLIPYIVHPVAVAALVAKHGGDEDQQIAALLHDVLEDGGVAFEPEVAKFGERVLSIVKGCTDGMPDAAGKKEDWLKRKTAYLQHLASAPDETLLVSGCDKLSNAQAILEDLYEIGSAVFRRFSATQEQTLWYYDSLSEIFAERALPVAPALRRTVAEILTLSAAAQRTEKRSTRVTDAMQRSRCQPCFSGRVHFLEA